MSPLPQTTDDSWGSGPMSQSGEGMTMPIGENVNRKLRTSLSAEAQVHHSPDRHIDVDEKQSVPAKDYDDHRQLQLRPVAPVDISVRNLGVQSDIKPSGLRHIKSCFSKKSSSETSQRYKSLLNQVNADMPAGTVTAIMGASGSGKTSFLNVLSERANSSHLHRSGDVYYNDSRELSKVRSAYVMQQDVLLPTLTVRETLYYAAELRLPPPTTAQERSSIIEEVILELGLKECANTRIGNDEHKGCSGGEKRRTSLAVQLLANPSILFLDEVTTGLDATSAFQLVKTLSHLARRGRTIVMTIHQPRSEIWGLFDHVLLLSGGSPLYSGPSESCLEHFAKSGHPLPPFVNPAEHLIDLAAVDKRSPELEASTEARVSRLKEAWTAIPVLPRDVRQISQGRDLAENDSGKRAGFSRQVRVQTQRSFKTTWRDPMGVVGSMVECLSMAILTGWIFLNLDGSQSGIRSREGALYTAAALQNYLILLFEIHRLTLDIGVFDRERTEGVVDVASFLVSRRLARFPVEDLPIPLVYSVIFYLMVGFRREATAFFVFFGFILLCQYAAVTFAMLAVACSRDFAGASLIANMNFTLQSVCSGFFIQSNQIPIYVRWFKWTAYIWYANGALITNEFIGQSNSPTGYLYECPYPGGAGNPACAPWTGRFIVRLLGYPINDWIWRPAIILVGFVGVFSFVAWVIFTFYKVEMRISKPKESKTETFIGKENLDARSLDAHRNLDVTLADFALDIEKVRLWNRAKQIKSIVRPINARFEPGILNVIMGVSGGGKTSLLNLMAKRLTSTYTTRYVAKGEMLFGGLVPSEEVVRSVTSYVCQTDDALLPNLTVRETLYFAAQLRLPTWMSKRDKLNRAQSVLEKLGLRDCADTLIGNEMVKGISGGEKRRVSIGIQILTEPRILLLDEPTSGLDAFTASSILSTLQGLAEEGRTVILTIHQSRSDVFQHFGNVLLLARGGFPVYTGPGKDMLSHFSRLGHPCPENVNPADFALDLISVDLQSSTKEFATREKVASLISSWSTTAHPPLTRVPSGTLSLPASLSSYARTRTHPLLATRLLLHRSALSLRRSPPALLARTTQVLAFGLILALFFAPLRTDYPGVQGYIGYLQEILAVYFIGMLQNISVYPGEAQVFFSEYADGAYGLLPFVVSYTLLEVPFEVCTAGVFGVLGTFAVGLPRTGPVFGVVSFACFALVSCGESVGMMFLALFDSTGFAVSLTSVVLSLGTIMSGVLSTNLPAFLSAWNHLSPGKWAMGALGAYTLKGVQFTCEEAERVQGRCPIENGAQVLELYNLRLDGGLSLVYLGVVVVGYRLFAFGLLALVKGAWRFDKIWKRKRGDS